jgi:multiple sugar transport system ATP-binding protein
LNALKLEKISKSFGRTEVLKDIDLAVAEGEFVVFVGPSGCGKSTLLRVIAGLEDASAGTVSIAGTQVNDVPPSKRGISMVFQTYALYPHLSVRGNMALALKQEGVARGDIAARIAEASRMLSLDGYLDRFPSELSGGQRQRVAIGRAIVRAPKLYLFDEPLSNLDAALRMNTRIEIAHLHRTLGATIVYVTHDQIEAMTLADKIVVIREGRIEQIGTPMELYNNPVNQFVAGFLGAPAMNFMPAEAIGGEGGLIVGIRPEHLRINSAGRILGIAIHVEKLGSDTNIVVNTQADQTVTIRMFGQFDIAVGSQMVLDFDAHDSFLFDLQGQRVRAP